MGLMLRYANCHVHEIISFLRCSQQYQSGILFVMFHRLPHSYLFVSGCEKGFHFWCSGQWPVSRHLRPSGGAGTSPPVSQLQWYGVPVNFVPRVNSVLDSRSDEKVIGKLTSRVVNAAFLRRLALDFSKSWFFVHSSSSFSLVL